MVKWFERLQKLGARFSKRSNFVACSNCFFDQGLRIDASRFGEIDDRACSHCGSRLGAKLTHGNLLKLMNSYFHRGTFFRADYGGAPLVAYNRHQVTSVEFVGLNAADLRVFEEHLGVGFFDYGPRLWMLGEVEPLKQLQDPVERWGVIERIIERYPTIELTSGNLFYRVRKGPLANFAAGQFDSPPDNFLGRGRIDGPGFPTLYASTSVDICVHECRFSAEDDLYVGTLAPTDKIRLLDLSVLLRDENVSEFESIDMAIHMLFLAGRNSYPICRDLARYVGERGFDGMIYSSYFSLLHTGGMPFETIMGISARKIPSTQFYEEKKTVQNIAIFGRPIADGRVNVSCINRLVVERVLYGFSFGPLLSQFCVEAL